MSILCVLLNGTETALGELKIKVTFLDIALLLCEIDVRGEILTLELIKLWLVAARTKIKQNGTFQGIYRCLVLSRTFCISWELI